VNYYSAISGVRTIGKRSAEFSVILTYFVALTSRVSVHSNPYVSVPYATVSALDLERSDDKKNKKKKDGNQNSTKSQKRKFFTCSVINFATF